MQYFPKNSGKRSAVYLLPLFFLATVSVMANIPVWGKSGHRVVGEVASDYLTSKSRRAVADLLEGRSLAYVSNYADEIKSDSIYDSYSPWHYVNYPFDKTYSQVSPSPYGDIISGIETCIRFLEDKDSSRADKVFYLKMLVHFMGDLHQPLHTGREKDRGGNDIQVRWFGSGSNLHRVWDSDMIDSYGMSYTELAKALPKLKRKERLEIQKGNIYSWVEESHQLAEKIYGSAGSGEKLGYSYSYKYWDTVEKQLQKAGLRLAGVLNDIFG